MSLRIRTLNKAAHRIADLQEQVSRIEIMNGAVVFLGPPFPAKTRRGRKSRNRASHPRVAGFKLRGAVAKRDFKNRLAKRWSFGAALMISRKSNNLNIHFG